MPVFWYFIKEIVLYDDEYGLNFDKNVKNADVSKKLREKPKYFWSAHIKTNTWWKLKINLSYISGDLTNYVL